VARGFESKSVADQQEAALGRLPSRADHDDGDPALKARRRRLELARADVLHQLERARAEPHRQMLQQALAAVDLEIAALDGAGS
jgi:hypothetical protein